MDNLAAEFFKEIIKEKPHRAEALDELKVRFPTLFKAPAKFIMYTQKAGIGGEETTLHYRPVFDSITHPYVVINANGKSQVYWARGANGVYHNEFDELQTSALIQWMEGLGVMHLG